MSTGSAIFRCIDIEQLSDHRHLVGVWELDQSKLLHLFELKNSTVSDATEQLGDASLIRDAFLGFQKHLYERRAE
ncbi:MAG: hypothetical protein ACI9UO_001678 [Nitrospinales bacterium]